MQALERALEQALTEAQRGGQVRQDVDCAAQARLLLALSQGLHVTARAETDPHRLDVVDAAIDAMT